MAKKETGASKKIQNQRPSQAKAAILEYIEIFYNRQRRHSGIGYQTPIQAYENMTWKMAA